jgi:hypothetical protein
MAPVASALALPVMARQWCIDVVVEELHARHVSIAEERYSCRTIAFGLNSPLNKSRIPGFFCESCQTAMLRSESN